MALMHFIDLDDADKEQLREIATTSIESGLSQKQYAPELNALSKSLQADGASFVTLTIQKELRGCIGSLEAYQPLALDVCQNAFSSAYRDPRFPSLSKSEWKLCSMSISVLTKPESIEVESEEQLLSKLVPGKDGLVLSWRHHRATYLPSVWEQLPEPSRFISELKVKAGLSPEFWSTDMTFKTYRSIVF